jgi:capsular exopolysaccharide synthesis family protein
MKQLQVQLAALRIQLADLTATYTAEHPKVVKVQAQIASLESGLAKMRADILNRIQNEYASSRRRESLLNADYSSQLGLITKQGDKVAQYAMLKQEVETTRHLYDAMFQKVKEAGLASSMRASDIQVIESATPPRLPFKPNVPLNLAFGLVSGLCIGVGFVVLRSRSDHRIHEPGDTALFLNVPELGVIPASNSTVCRIAESRTKRLWNGEPQNGVNRLELATLRDQVPVIAESFRLALTSILFSEQNGVHPRVLVLSSTYPGEGKTTVASNLGIAFAQINQRVVLVDGDMRRPRLHEIFDVDNSVGLSDALAGKAPLSVLQTKVPNLYILPSGGTRDAGLLFTPQLLHLLRRLRSEFDMVLIDSPPMLQMSDARILGRHSDAVILVVGQFTTREALLQAHQKLCGDGSYLLGTILNNWNPKMSRSDYRNNYERYQQYYTKEK